MNKKETLGFHDRKSYAFLQKNTLKAGLAFSLLFMSLPVSYANEANSNAKTNITTIAQQTSRVTGVVTDSYGEPVIGANVIEKGTTNGTITDFDGNFVLELSSNAILQISYIGYHTQEINYTGQTPINITLIEDTQALDEVVVTALGIKREKKALGYSMQEVKGDGLTETRDVNVANALSGKVAGLQITQNGTGAMGSTNILIRGNNSIAGNNQPLVVVDGVPIDNFSGEADWNGNGAVDKGSGISDISPDDIESISVLKGPAAAALYGSRAGNGVVMITTKKGTKSSGAGITYNANVTFDSPMQTPSFQNEYGQGSGGVYSSDKLGSWGPRMNGEVVDMALGKFAYAARDNNLYKDFLRTGTTWTNSVDISKATEEITFRASVTRLDNKAIVPNSGFNRTSINLRSTAKLTNWLSVDMKVNYVNQDTKNRIKMAQDPDNIFSENLKMPRSVGFSDYEAYRDTDWKRADGKPASFKDNHDISPHNPYWSAYRNTNSDKKDRLLAFAAFDITFTDWLSLKLRSGMDSHDMKFENIRATGTPYWETNGNYIVKTEKFKEINSDFLLTAQGNWDKFGIVGAVGGNIMYRSSHYNIARAGELVIPDFYSIYNGKQHTAEFEKSRKQINSIYGTASLSWDDYLYLDLTARNDWSSTLPKENSSYFYPSIGASWVFTQMINKMGGYAGPFTFGKLRLSWAQVGNDTDPYQLLNYYDIGYDIKGSLFSVSARDFLANPNLKNETINSWEIGLEARAFDNRIGIDVAYYQKNSKDQILKVDVPSATGYKYKLINAGNIENKGVEIALDATPVKTAKGFTWDTQINWSKNINKVVSLTEGTSVQLLANNKYIQIVAEEGGSFGDIYGYAYQRNENGNIIVGEDGTPLRSETMEKLGNNQPDWMMGWSNSFSYKNFTLSFLFDLRYGGSVYMSSIRNGNLFGNLEETLKGRDGMVIPGVLKSGEANTKEVTSEAYWTAMSELTEPFIYDATNLRLRELSIGYTVPRATLAKTPFTGVKLSLIARNLWMIHTKTKGFDPEAGYSNGTAQGIEYGSMPALRSIGVNLNVSF